MGKRKLGHNWRARVPKETHIDESAEKKIVLDLDALGMHQGAYDASNPIAVPTQGRKVATVSAGVTRKKVLSKKERRNLESVIERRRKKEKRAQLLEDLSRVQASSEELKMLQSVVHISRKKNTAKHRRKDRVNSGAAEQTSQREVALQDDALTPSEDDTDGSSEGNDHNVKASVSAKTAVELCKNERQQQAAGSCAVSSSALPCSGSDAKTAISRPVLHVPVDRPAEIQAARLRLPVVSEEQRIMEAINDNPVVVVCGETGSGKTTQIPQFLYEAGYTSNGKMIGVTEPRRVAAISMSKRVAAELVLSERQVAYQIRFEGTACDQTLIKFMTDGVLLKELQQDFLLSRYSAIVIDEAHERSAYTDILIGLLSRIVKLREKRGSTLKLIIMSATLRVEDFVENRLLFSTPPPLVQVDARQYPVTVHFNRFTPVDNYMDETLRKVCKIHREYPEGGMLVFVTGQQEVNMLCRRLRHLFPSHNKLSSSSGADTRRATATEKGECDAKGQTEASMSKVFSLDGYSALPIDEQADLMMPGSEDESKDDDDLAMRSMENDKNLPLHVLPLYSLLPSKRQMQVFEPQPPGTRLCVIATNVAETSLTIPNVKYVVDTGKVKVKLYDKVTGVSTFQVCWTSKASANQRAGRAGRTGPGHCFRLYSSSVFNDEFQKFSVPEISSRPVEDLVLQMKAMGIDRVINFPFPTAPSVDAIKAAEELLLSLGALELHQAAPTAKTSSQKISKGKALSAAFTRITKLGRTMSLFPLSPRYAKMLIQAEESQVLDYAIALVSAFTVREIFSESCHLAAEDDDDKESKAKLQHLRKSWAGTGELRQLGDAVVYLKAVGACEFEDCSAEFCNAYGLRQNAMMEVRKLRHQLTNIVNSVWPHVRVSVDKNMKPPETNQAQQLRQVILAGLVDRVARFAPMTPTDDCEKSTSASAITRAEMKHTYQCGIFDEPLHIHPESVMFREDERYIVFQEAVESSGKMFAKGVTAIDPEWLPTLASRLCSYSAPLLEPEPHYDEARGVVMCHRTSTYGPHAWQIPAISLEYPPCVDRYKWFARFLLEGTVIPALAKYRPVLLSAPSTMVKYWSKLQPRTEHLLRALYKEGVDSKAKLVEAWNKDAKYLATTYLDWLPQSLHEQVTKTWPPEL